ncbi:MAG: ATP-grasp domain-containing protein [Planctomycetota bacterium]|jgi:hypothetical protein
MSASKHLLINAYRSNLDFERVARLVEEYAPDIRAFVVRDRRSPFRALGFARRPTLLFSVTPLSRLRLWRGTVCQGRRLDKAQELSALDAAGVATPAWFLLDSERNVKEEAAKLGKYVVLKPNVACRGQLVRIAQTSRVRWKPKYAEHSGQIVQRFVYTGRWPVAYRVTTLFGEVLFCARTEANHDRPPLDGRWGWQDGGRPVTANAKGGTWTLADDEDVLDLARAAARVFPDVGLLGIDIVRDIETKKCAVLEVNAVGHTWHFTSELGRSVQRDNDIDFEAQFDGVRLAARVLAEETRRRAT